MRFHRKIKIGHGAVVAMLSLEADNGCVVLECRTNVDDIGDAVDCIHGAFGALNKEMATMVLAEADRLAALSVAVRQMTGRMLCPRSGN